MRDKREKVRAICLVSGGLDSILAPCVLREQGIEVEGLTFSTPFFGPANAKKGCEQIGIPLNVMDISKEHLELVKKPPRGYGKNMNPCIDCHAMMVKKAGEFMLEKGFDFIATGEVLNERPMSQNKDSLGVVAKESGFADYLLRPLSAKLLPATLPERDGRVNRDRLLAIEGRSRRPQMALAKKYGIKEYVQPSGGCLLTDPAFSARLKDLFLSRPLATIEDVNLLKLGRHFRLSSGARVIVGRNKKDNELLIASRRAGFTMFVSDVVPGPAVLTDATLVEDIETASVMCASFADNGGQLVDMLVISDEGKRRVNANPRSKEEFVKMRIGK